MRKALLTNSFFLERESVEVVRLSNGSKIYFEIAKDSTTHFTHILIFLHLRRECWHVMYRKIFSSIIVDDKKWKVSRMYVCASKLPHLLKTLVLTIIRTLNTLTISETTIFSQLCNTCMKQISQKFTWPVPIANSKHVLSEFIFTLSTRLVTIAVTHIMQVALILKAADAIGSVLYPTG